MLGLGAKVGGQPLRVGRAVTDDHDFGGPGGHIDRDLTHNLQLGRRDIGFAWTDDLVAPADALGPVGERRDRLGAAHRVDLGNAGQRGGGEDGGRDMPVTLRWRAEDDLLAAGDPRGNRHHRNRRRINSATAGHIKADAAEGAPFAPHLDARRDDDGLLVKLLSSMNHLDAADGFAQRLTDAAVEALERRLPSIFRDPAGRQPDTVVALSQIRERAVPAIPDGGDRALADLTERYDGVRLATSRVPKDAWEAALEGLDRSVGEALSETIRRVEVVHRAQQFHEEAVVVVPGVEVWREWRPFSRVGLYVPGGRTVYPSSVPMMAVPARIAGCEEIVLC